jgi:hypothetical protein
MGAGIAASPHCAERRICRCSLALVSPREGFDPASRSWLTSSGVAFHPAAPSCEEPGRSTRLRRPKARWSFDLPGLAPELRSEDLSSGQNRPMFRGPSWVDHSRVPLCPSAPRCFRTASRWRKIDSSGASSRLAPTRTRKLFPMPAGGDRSFGRLPHLLAVSGPPGRLGLPSRSPEQHAPRCRVGEAKFLVTSLWIMWISGTTIGTFPAPPLGCRSVPSALPPASA